MLERFHYLEFTIILLLFVYYFVILLLLWFLNEIDKLRKILSFVYLVENNDDVTKIMWIVKE